MPTSVLDAANSLALGSARPRPDPLTLRRNSAMAAGVTDHVWSLADPVALWESEEQEEERAA